MKKLLLLFVLCITIFSCDTSPEPIYKVNGEIVYSSSFDSKNHQIYQSLTDSLNYKIMGDNIFIKTTSGDYYEALLVSNTNYIDITLGEFIVWIFVFMLLGGVSVSVFTD